jgi:thiol:disulfide interchange protein
MNSILKNISGFCASLIFTASISNAAVSYQSVEGQKVQAALTSAKTTGKLIVVDMSAAWCGPCANLAKQLVEQKDQVKSTWEKIDFIKLEEMQLEVGFGADFFPT